MFAQQLPLDGRVCPTSGKSSGDLQVNIVFIVSNTMLNSEKPKSVAGYPNLFDA